ncbi:ArsR/SmtB family transcription factor [Halorussus lipolyticus]|uniref:ArsR/SmtB family transcription factor n=1 Tax=Halorussus lipolyticus TaxID=3034024 RepID=UPI0023E86EAE|nr:winged helix-turn-helix domain-containing protein [Halorussus sp. DT80]
MSEESDVSDVAALLDNATVRQMLVEARTEALSARELADRCGVSTPTVYRRLEALQRYDMMTETMHVDDDGHHHKVYSSDLERVSFEFTDDGVEVVVSGGESMSERFVRLVEEL